MDELSHGAEINDSNSQEAVGAPVCRPACLPREATGGQTQDKHGGALFGLTYSGPWR